MLNRVAKMVFYAQWEQDIGIIGKIYKHVTNMNNLHHHRQKLSTINYAYPQKPI